jgi:hypothetical protein
MYLRLPFTLACLLLVLPAAPAQAPDDLAAVAKKLIDNSVPGPQKQALLEQHRDRAAELVAALAADLKPGMAEEEYRRIPWIWRVSIAAGRRDDPAVLRRLLDVSLPKGEAPLRDWQAVVLGGGIVNGLSLQGHWPARRLDELMKEQPDLAARWRRAVELSAAMADDEKVPTGTRYDALRMIAMDARERRGEQLARYLARGVHDELQMGAISGLADMDVPQAGPLLVGGLGHFSAGNRKLALDALLRTDARAAALLDAIEQGKAQPALVTPEHAKKLREHKSEAVRTRAARLLPP